MRAIKRHIVFWFFYFWYCFLTDYILEGLTSVLFELILFLTHNILLFYGLYFSLKHFSLATRRKALIGGSLFLLVIAVFIIIKYIDYLYIFPNLFDPRYKDFDRRHIVVRIVMAVVMYFFYASAYFYFTSYREKQQAIFRMVEEQLKKDKERLELENSLLRSQINPHFLYNTLNFFYAKSLSLSEDLSEGIMKLSEIMHYSLRKQDSDGLVCLNEELEHIRNIIELARLRFSGKFYFDSDFDQFSDTVRVIPLVFITLAENILKHAELTNSLTPASISIKYQTGNLLKFRSSNQKRRAIAEKTSGIGLVNTQARLREAYGEGNFRFDVNESSDEFSVTVIIPVVQKS